jgi:chromosome segregation ATPase
LTFTPRDDFLRFQQDVLRNNNLAKDNTYNLKLLQDKVGDMDKR